VEACCPWARTSGDRVVRMRACICAHPASRSPVLTIMSAICTIFDSLMSPPNAYHDDHLSEGRAVGEWMCLPCMHAPTARPHAPAFQKEAIDSRGHQHSTPSLGYVAYPMGGVRASPSSRARAEWSPDNEKMVSKAVVYPMAPCCRHIYNMHDGPFDQKS
jgi:hypothetical protein